MATHFVASKDDKAKASKIEALIDNGTMPKPPALHGVANTCAMCGELTLLARFYIPRVGWGCEACFDEWRTTPVRCSTRASDVHIGCIHIIPQCVIDAEAKQNASQTLQDGPGSAEDSELYTLATGALGRTLPAYVFATRELAEDRKMWDAMKVRELYWTAARKASEARRGNVMQMPWKVAA